MKLFSVSSIFYALPLVFFVLTGSPNLNGERIGLTLIIVCLSFLTASYFSNRIKVIRKSKKAEALALLFMIVITVLGWSNGLEYMILIVLWPILFMLTSSSLMVKILLPLTQAFVLFCIIYFGINQYSFYNLSNTRVLGMILVFVVQYLYLYSLSLPNYNLAGREIKLLLLIVVVSLSLYSGLMFDLKYMIYLFVLLLPSVLVLLQINRVEQDNSERKKVGLFRILTLVGLALFNLYLFLDSTQVLQAVKAGY